MFCMHLPRVWRVHPGMPLMGQHICTRPDDDKVFRRSPQRHKEELDDKGTRVLF